MAKDGDIGEVDRLAEGGHDSSELRRPHVVSGGWRALTETGKIEPKEPHSTTECRIEPAEVPR
jgi:hypothetical protein